MGDPVLHNKKTAHAVPLASARQHPENQKENQAGHSPERTVEGRRGGATGLGFTARGLRGQGWPRWAGRPAHREAIKRRKRKELFRYSKHHFGDLFLHGGAFWGRDHDAIFPPSVGRNECPGGYCRA